MALGFKEVADEYIGVDANELIGDTDRFSSDLGRVQNAIRRKKTRRSRKSRVRKSKANARRVRHKRHVVKSRGGIRYTKNGQPYKILSSGKARFLKKKRR